MIYVKLIGRLGNQLFYYSVARSIQMKYPKYGEIVIIPNNDTGKWGGVQLLEFNCKIGGVVESPSLSCGQWMVEKSFKAIRSLFRICNLSTLKYTSKCQKLINTFGIYCMEGSKSVQLEFNDKNKDIYISGVWENPYYFNDIRETLLEEIKPKRELIDYNIKLMQHIRSCTSVCISIRKGDFLAKGNEIFNVCSDDYYKNAVAVMKNYIGAFDLFVFSDDINWCKHNLNFDVPTFYENNDGNDPTWEKLRLMSSCNHFIISNSSFSWWAQYLGTAKNKITIAPTPWRRNEECDCLYDDSFILLDGKTGQIMSKPYEII